MKTILIMYNWDGVAYTEEIPAPDIDTAKELFLQKMLGNNTTEELNSKKFFIISIRVI